MPVVFLIDRPGDAQFAQDIARHHKLVALTPSRFDVPDGATFIEHSQGKWRLHVMGRRGGIRRGAGFETLMQAVFAARGI